MPTLLTLPWYPSPFSEVLFSMAFLIMDSTLIDSATMYNRRGHRILGKITCWQNQVLYVCIMPCFIMLSHDFRFLNFHHRVVCFKPLSYRLPWLLCTGQHCLAINFQSVLLSDFLAVMTRLQDLADIWLLLIILDVTSVSISSHHQTFCEVIYYSACASH